MYGNISGGAARVLGVAAIALLGLSISTGSASAAGNVTLSGNAYSFIFGGHTERLPGAQIGIDELPGVTATAGANGAYSLKVPDNTTITPYATMPGYHKIYLQTFHTRGSDLRQINFQMPPDEIYSALGVILGTNLDPETGDPVKCAIVTTMFKESARHYDDFDDFWGDTPHGVEGSTAAGSTNAGRLLPPTTYFNSQVIPDPAQPSTSDDGGAIWDEVETGEYTIKGHKPGTHFSPFQATCKPGRLINANPPWGLYQLAPGERPNPAVYPDRVEARLAAARTVRNGKRRSVSIRVAPDEPVKVKLIIKQGNTIQTKAYPGFWTRERTVALPLRKKFKRARASLRVRLTDKAGNRETYERILRVPRS